MYSSGDEIRIQSFFVIFWRAGENDPGRVWLGLAELALLWMAFARMKMTYAVSGVRPEKIKLETRKSGRNMKRIGCILN